MKFKTEKELLETTLTTCFMQQLADENSITHYMVEPRGLFGIPDLVVTNVRRHDLYEMELEAVAFELKLSNWKRALAQAFRYKAFAETAYVVIDFACAGPAMKNLDRFKRCNVGLISVDCCGGIAMHYRPEPDEPYCVRTRSSLMRIVKEKCH